MSSIVIDTCVIRLYDTPSDPRYSNLFKWLNSEGKLYVSQKLLNEYYGTQNREIEILLSQLNRDTDNKRLFKIGKNEIESFKGDKNYNYTCNKEDHYHARLVFLSPRKKLISQDKKIIDDINKFKNIDQIKPAATNDPTPEFYT